MKKASENALLSRYLIEDNNSGESDTNSVGVICSVLRHLMGNYTLLNEDDVQRIKSRLKVVFQVNLPKLVETFTHYS